MCISNTAPPPKKRNTHAQTCRVSHTAGGMRGATAFRTGAPQIEVASNSPVLKAAFLQVAKRLAAFFYSSLSGAADSAWPASKLPPKKAYSK